MGSSEAQTKGVTNSQIWKYKCPTIVNKENWLGGYGYSDTFSVEQREAHIVVTRTDSYGGWGMNLEFRCCRCKDSYIKHGNYFFMKLVFQFSLQFYAYDQFS